jgi:hypothetical protein
MKASNGKGTNLNERQWLQVQTKSFSDWFGDWINNSENASKVVDENGESLPVYHGSPNEFTKFKGNKEYDNAIWFASNKDIAQKDYVDGNGSVYEVFLNLKIRQGTLTNICTAQKNMMSLFRDIRMEALSIGVLTASNPSQIKSATGNNGNFDNASDDIRFQASCPKPDFAGYSGDFLAFAKDVAEWNLENRKRSNNFVDNNSVNNNIENVRQFIKDVLDGKIKDGKHYIELSEHVNKPAEKVLGHPIKSHRIKADEIRHI